MKFKKRFEKQNKFTDEQIKDIEELIKTGLPSDYKSFLKQTGGQEFEEDDDFEFYLTIDEKNGIVPFIRFFNFDYLKWQIGHFIEDEDLIAISPLDKYLPIGECHGQYRILIGISDENRNRIYLFNVEELEILFLADNIEHLINHKILLENELETTC
jgi:hypothetical protein